MSDEVPTCRKGLHPKTPELWVDGRCRECHRAAAAARRGVELKPMRVYDPDWFPCGHSRSGGNLGKRGQCKECDRLRSAEVAQAAREARIAEYGSGRRRPSTIDPESFKCGHPRTAENTHLTKEGWSAGCRKCRNVKKRETYDAKLAAARKPRRVVDPGRFHCGHPRTRENTTTGGYNCKECARLKQFERNRARIAAEGREVWKPDPDWFPCGHPRITANLTKSKQCRACANQRKLDDYHLDGKRPTGGDPDLIRARNRAYVQCRRDERADPETWDYVQIVRRDPCSYCGGPGGTRDHVISMMASGGPNHWANYTGACASCNVSKGDKALLAFLLDRLMLQKMEEHRSA